MNDSGVLSFQQNIPLKIWNKTLECQRAKVEKLKNPAIFR
jgi:hypothetical protein